jgi:hypothetical protein
MRNRGRGCGANSGQTAPVLRLCEAAGVGACTRGVTMRLCFRADVVGSRGGGASGLPTSRHYSCSWLRSRAGGWEIGSRYGQAPCTWHATPSGHETGARAAACLMCFAATQTMIRCFTDVERGHAPVFPRLKNGPTRERALRLIGVCSLAALWWLCRVQDRDEAVGRRPIITWKDLIKCCRSIAFSSVKCN